jgi:predicted nucleic acid-binding protein
MAFVLDASIAASWALLDEDNPVAAVALERIRTESTVAPMLFWFEVRNIRVVSERRGRLSPVETTEFLNALSKLPLTMDLAPDEASVLHLARIHNLTVYDASYLELARREGTTLATLNQSLARAAEAEGITLLRS